MTRFGRTKTSVAQIEFVADNDGFSKAYQRELSAAAKSFRIWCAIEGQPDLLSDILKSLTPVRTSF